MTGSRISSIWVITSAGSLTPDAFTLSSTCSGRDAPMIAAATLSFCSTHATASCAIVQSDLVGDRLELLHAGRARRRASSV